MSQSANFSKIYKFYDGINSLLTLGFDKSWRNKASLNLKGKKVLVRGNHDYQPDEFYKEAGFVDVVDYFKIPPYFINHYPCYESRWTSGPEKAMMFNLNRNKFKTVIHGHIHNKNPNEWESDGIDRINVCVDYAPNDFKPVRLDQPEIVSFFTDKY